MININFQIKAEKFQESTRSYMQEKVDRLEKLLGNYESFTISINPIANSKFRFTIYRLMITVKMPQAYVKVENTGNNINKVFDKLIEPLQKKLNRYHSQDSRWNKLKERKLIENLADVPLEDISQDGEVISFEPNIRYKYYDDDKPLHPAEAVEKMELLGNNCYLFKNIENNRYAMICKVDDSNYTLVQPEK
jgi:ribosomal subunit interface protein